MPDSFDLGEPPQLVKPEAYRVLARKYRPRTFSELIGQGPMIRTLENAIKRGRIAHAFLMTGVRGVGKTSTARLIAKALNCIGPDGGGGPTIDPCGVCEPCRAIAEGRHIDVIEIDAASNNGVDNVREMTDAVRYASVSARYKMYIIDEVHMMSKPAFNALLKTLEEPPAHVKFLLATTEVDKVPVTVLSRCQRFDLRRIPANDLATHFADVCEKEGVVAAPDALMLIARAAEGSARDGLSILDQAIAHAGLEGGGVEAEAVRQMLGLSDRGAVRDLLGMILAGDGGGALAALRRQYDHGIDPASVLRGLLETVHRVTLAKVGAADDPTQPAEERAALEDWSGKLSFPMLHRLWQLLLKGHDEVARAALPIEAAEMALLRCIHASSLPDPGDLARRLAGGTIAVAAPAALPAPVPAPVAAASAPTDARETMPADLGDLVTLLRDNGQPLAAEKLRIGASVVLYAAPELVLSGARPISTDSLRDIGEALRTVTGRAWTLSLRDEPGAPTIKETEEAARAASRQAILDTPMVRAAFAAFPDAELLEPTDQRSAI